MMMTEMEKLVPLCQQLQSGAKTPVQGKAATFQKVLTLRLCTVVMKKTCLLFLILHTVSTARQSAQSRFTAVSFPKGIISFESIKTTSPTTYEHQ